MPTRPARGPILALAALLALGGGPARARPAEGVETAMRWLGDAPALLSHPGGGAAPAVILLGDGQMADGRSEVYARRLLALGIALLDIDLAGSRGSETGDAEEPRLPLHRRLELALEAVQAEPGIDPAHVAVLGLGEGARAMLLARPAATRLVGAALLYPGCDPALGQAARDGAGLLGGLPVLLLHGDTDPVNESEACEGLAAGIATSAARVTHAVLRNATYAWDVVRMGGPGVATLLPNPGGAPGRIRAEADPVNAEVGVERVLTVLLPALTGAGRAR